MFIGLAKICLAAGLMALVCWAANYWCLDTWEQLRFVPKLCALFGTIVVSAAIFLGTTLLLGVDELRDIFDLVRRRLGRGE
jgi:peptidoglycan biosynthesis protein MviN/MurJ (putative lipid II flippase)